MKQSLDFIMSEIPIFKIRVFAKFVENPLFNKIIKNLILSVNGNKTKDFDAFTIL